MAMPETNAGLPARIAIRRGEAILAKLEIDGADFVGMDEHHAYVWCHERLVNLYDHQDLIDFLTKHGYVKPRTENKMIIAAAVIIEGIKRCE